MAQNLAAIFVVLFGLVSGTFAADTSRRTYANPVDVDYRYNFEQVNEQISYRTGADPVIVRHKDAYYLFMTLADGYWRSTNLLDWKFITPSRWPFESVVAPAAISDGDRLLLLPSITRPDAVLVSDDPARGHLDFLTRRLPPLPGAVSGEAEGELGRWHLGDAQPEHVQPGPWDPALFKDDDGRWYLYWGSSNKFPLYGIELDMREAVSQQRIHYIGKPRALVQLEPKQHGWERFGQDHTGEDRPTYIEGAWMTKHGGRYYLQYGAPGTEFNVYATGTYVSSNPLGPFEYAPYNPVGYKPGGFVHGAGHGNTFQDEYGNWWNTGTPWIGYNWTFERRIALFPAAFSDDGQMSVNTRFADFPNYMPQGLVTDSERLFTGWMLLSYRKHATASSVFGPATSSAPAALRMRIRARSGLRHRTRPDKHSPWISAPAKRCAPCRSISPTIYLAVIAMRRTSTRNSRSSRLRTASGGNPWPPPDLTGAIGPMRIFSCPRQSVRVTCVMCTGTSALHIWRSAICACSATLAGPHRARLPTSRRYALKTGA